ncbi:DNA repair protein RadA [Vulgatibacter incomptus]|uniref:DNA repair protein RadA n=1 Tax=Vulgatibacter incomptus TaxID=1391653 RepID=A0A0K1PGQ3_9BACT|nr:DNA repair protein RadA [Vulgatibacter incomptus]AKU92289.1 DNA repair protein RadA [Vulgatibacter incomptus]
MAKKRTEFVCQACGHRSIKWLGQCPSCKAWSSLSEEVAEARGGEVRPAWGAGGTGLAPTPIRAIEGDEAARIRTGIAELDRVLGGGVVPGALILLGGDPGIGKSTLLLAALDRLASSGGGRPVLYVSGEESLRQTKLRGDRLGASSENLLLLAETDAERVLAQAEKLAPLALAVDSIQTLFLPELGSAPGTVSQVREVAGRLMAFAKRTDTPTFIVGHVTKDGSIAGPRILEHMVDTVLYFEGEASHTFRVLRAHKNRFGSTNEIGVFEMRSSGLSEVADPSALFLAERPVGQPGSVVTPTVSGTRPLLVEVQALVAPTQYGTGQRKSIGVDPNRVALLAAVLERKLGLSFGPCDIFVNVAGGVELDEPAADLAVCAALVSSRVNVAVPASAVFFGEVGLAGEVRAVTAGDIRLAEASKMGFSSAYLPATNLRRLEAPELPLVGVSSVRELLEALFPDLQLQAS